MHTISHKRAQTAHDTESLSDVSRSSATTRSKQSARSAIFRQVRVQSIALSAAAASRRYARVSERPSRAQASSSTAWSAAGQQHAHEHVASICMPCATHLTMTIAAAIFFASSSSSAPWSQGLGSTPSATTRESSAKRERGGASARCKASRRSR